MTEDKISLLLDTFMYLDYRGAKNGMTMEEILKELSDAPDCMEGGNHYAEYCILTDAVRQRELGQLIIGNQSRLMGYDEGTAACTFHTPDKSCMYVVYRGTGDGEWPDNGIGMTEASTVQQQKALAYFETVVEKENITDKTRVVVTGHSKGGNKAQYVTMSTKYEDLPDACYNVDGQGFSEDAVEVWKNTLGYETYEKRRGKITGIYGENDYVNVLGHSIVPEQNRYYIKTPAEKNHFATYHDITYMYAKQRQNPKTGDMEIIFDGSCNDYALNRGKISDYVAKLSEEMMKLPKRKRDGCAAVLMQMMEAIQGRKQGINGEYLTLLDLDDFLWNIMPLVRDTTLFTGEGLMFLQAALWEKTYAVEMRGYVNLRIQSRKIKEQLEQLFRLARVTEAEMEKMNALLEKTGNNRTVAQVYQSKLMQERTILEKTVNNCRGLASKLWDVLDVYQIKDEEAALFFL